jgi:hypothetical protein
LDDEFLALSIVFMVLGMLGIILFSSLFSSYHSWVPVPTQAGDGCFCLISSPEPSAAQGTSSIILALGVMFFPMGLMKGGLPSFKKGPSKPMQLPGGRVVSPVPLNSGSLFAFGLIVLLIGLDAVFVPGYLVFMNRYYELAGVLLAAAGAISIVWGQMKPKGQA